MSVDIQQQTESDSQVAFVRTAGFLGLVVAVTGILINVVFESAGPAPNAPIEEVVAFISERTLSLQIGNGLRMAVAGLLPVFAVGVYIWLGPLGDGWRMVGMLGLAMVPVAGIIANSAGTVALWRLPSLADQPELATMLWSNTVVLFYLLQVPYAVGVAGFSLAGRAAARMPRWLWTLGLLFGATGFSTTAGINVVVTRDWIGGLALSGYLLLLVWLAAVSIRLIRSSQGGRDSATHAT